MRGIIYFSTFGVVMSIVSALTAEPIRVGIIGLDTSHAPAFAREINNPTPHDDIAGCRVVAAYPQGSRDIASSVTRIPEYTAEFEKMGIEVVDSIDALLAKVDCVCLETNDGRPHLEQAIPVLKAKKKLFIDKPIAASLADAVAIYRVANHEKTPVWSASSLRYTEGAQAIRGGAIGHIFGCDAFSPCPTEATHPDLFWYGIHGVETLFTVMGSECESIHCIHTNESDVVVGRWSRGRIGTFRGLRQGKTGYGGVAFGEKGIREIGTYGGYRPLVVEIVKFFKSGAVPVEKEETLAIYAFMQAAEESKKLRGEEVKLPKVRELAEQQATKRLAELGLGELR